MDVALRERDANTRVVEAFFDIFYNVSLDGVGDDSLRLAGGSAATITSGTYDVLSPNSGRITCPPLRTRRSTSS